MKNSLAVLMTMHKVLHPRDDIDSFYATKICLDDAPILRTEDGSTLGLKDYFKRTKKKTPSVASNKNNNLRISKKQQRKLEILNRKNNWRDCVQEDLDMVKKGNSQERKRISLVAVQNNAIKINDIKTKLDNT